MVLSHLLDLTQLTAAQLESPRSPDRDPLVHHKLHTPRNWESEDALSQVDRDLFRGSPNPRKRPRRGAAITARRFDLDLSDGPPSCSAASDKRGHTSRPDEKSSSHLSTRKISHSLIERRRRERINDCLSQLKRLVPQCREYGEQKVRRAHERGRNRLRANDPMEDSSGGSGLHKLEILQVSTVLQSSASDRCPSNLTLLLQRYKQGTILYISELQGRVQLLEEQIATPSNLLDSNHACCCKLAGPPAATDHMDAAALLLKFSTSPELRPVSI
ncbi:BZ3500_MvSof-1268-A1-R1_Chr8-1g09927 [Microbotryum saponariae]|uniref:BZ3500_MvSof-1268-A1-R1_Chr8-1g09927 protein n=1 Tax=Microbotryum saponariae TaxID=289078 RepID=A0A2X0M7U8_9BASI|nr:BZ3500_MvSof-1268-A1-R1_Chr8-1g09927 [Microbotryum saponariae]SDA08213.1 BZ3501_MvSof-1269-A2-R1_Chr8-1g09650 [Microbotryum saponariae]